jgi:hypothetical protein
MGLIKKVDVKAYFAARRGMSVTAALEASKQARGGFSNARPADAGAASAEFHQDFSSEHSSHSSQNASGPRVAD